MDRMSDIPIDALIRQLMMESMSPEEQNVTGAIPAYDLEGDPYSTTSMLNQLQDVNSLMADPLFQGMGGIGGFSQQSFAPSVRYEMVESPEYQKWRNYINSPMSFEGLIAAELQEGGTPYSAMRKIQQRIAEDPEGELSQSLLMNFPVLDMGVPTEQIDWTAAARAATEIDNVRAAVPQLGGAASITMPDGSVVPGGEIMDVGGQLVRRIEEPSELQQKFDELGIPNPYEEYSIEDFLPPGWSDEGVARAQQQTDLARQEMLRASEDLGQYTRGPMQRPSEQRQTTEEKPARQEESGGPVADVGGVLGSAWSGLSNFGDTADRAAVDIGRNIGQEGLINYLRNRGAGGWRNLSEFGERLDRVPGNIYEDIHENYRGEPGAWADAQIDNAVEGVWEGAQGAAPGQAAVGFWDRMRSGGPGEAIAGWLDDLMSPNAPTDVREALGLPPGQADVVIENGQLVNFPSQQGGGPGGRPRVIKPRGMPRGEDEPEPEPRGGLNLGQWLAMRGQEPPTELNLGQQLAMRGQEPPTELNLGQQLATGGVRPPPADSSYGPQPVDRETMTQYLLQQALPGSEDRDWYPERSDLPVSGEARGARDGRPRTSLPVSGEARGARPRTALPDVMREFLLPRSESVDWYPESNLPRSESVDWYPTETGERRTRQERNLQSRRNAPRGLQGETYDVATSASTPQRRNQESRRRFRDAWTNLQRQKQQTYNYEHGYAMGMARNVQEAGITPTQQVYAQRMQNIINAGIPLGNQPGVVRY